MKHFITLVVIPTVLILFFKPSLVTAKEANNNIEVIRFRKEAEKHLSHPCLKEKNFGIKFVSLDRGDILLDMQSDRQFIPASNQKLITSAASLRYLGPNYRFPTELYAAGEIENMTLKGDLYFKGFGDPKLVSEQMWLLANQLKNLPIRKLEGDIVADDSYFDSIRRIKSWREKSGPQAYNAPLGALSFNFNTVRALIQPSLKVGDQPLVIIDPETEYIKVSNIAKTVPLGMRNRLIVNRLDREGFDRITVTGKIRQNAPRAKYYLNISDPPIYTATVFKEYLNRAGVAVGGIVRAGKTPNGIKRIVRHQSEPLSLILRGLNKFSNNFTAEQLVKALGVRKYGEPGTSENGVTVISEYMESLGFSPNDFKMVDGSGLSHENKLTPNQIVAVLLDVFQEQSIYPEYIASLSVMGVDGSTADRLVNFPKASRVRAKTGTLNGVSTLSGYLQSRNDERFAFSILMNNLSCNVNTAIRIQNKIIADALNIERKQSNAPVFGVNRKSLR